MLYDITPTISPRLAVWPGDTPPSREVLMEMRRGDNLTLSTLRATVHLGAHVDAPSHYGAEAPSIESATLETYVGPCRVQHVDVRPGQRVPAEWLPHPLETERLLLATGTHPDPETFREDFAALEPALIEQFADAGGRLIGIDTPSVDLFHSKALEAHQACLRRGVSILEGIDLSRVPTGRYELIALPLKLEGFDASPVRAVLRAVPPAGHGNAGEEG